MTYGCQAWSPTKALVKKLETSQWVMERKMLYVKLKDRIHGTITKQRTRVTDIVQYVTNVKWKWAGHIARVKDNRWTIRSTEWQIKDVRSVERSKRWRDDNVGQQGVIWTRIAKDRETCSPLPPPISSTHKNANPLVGCNEVVFVFCFNWCNEVFFVFPFNYWMTLSIA